MLNFISPWATQFTREKHEGKKSPQINMLNRKPYRTVRQKAVARDKAFRAKDGTYRSHAPVSYHAKAASSAPRS